MREKLNQSEPQLIRDCSTSNLLSVQQKKQSSATVEFPQQNRKTTLRAKSLSCETSSQKLKLFKMSGQDSISSEKDSGPYWSERCAELSSQLWLPTETVLRGLGSNSSSLLLSKPVEKSWFSTEFHSAQKKNSQKICLKYFTSSPADSMDSDVIVRKSKKIRIYPNKTQQQIFKKWFGVQRFVYNKTVELLRTGKQKANWKNLKGGVLHDLPDWTKEVPYQIKSVAVRDACRAVSNAKRKYLATKRIQQVAFRTRKNPKQSCFIPKKAVSAKGLYHTLTGQLFWTEDLPPQFGDSRLIWENGRWFVCISYSAQVKRPENQGRLVSLDPGVRTFLTLYSPDGCGKIGVGDFGRIVRLCHHLDSLKSKHAKATGARKSRLKKAIWRHQWRIRDLVNELHHKAARYLVENYDVIFIPEFKSQEMVCKTARKINNKTARMLLTWAHYRFRQFLQHKAREFGKSVVIVNEAYTSKTISWTGELIPNLGGRKIVQSKLTGDRMDRDYNGARGIFLRALEDSPSDPKDLSIVSQILNSRI